MYVTPKPHTTTSSQINHHTKSQSCRNDDVTTNPQITKTHLMTYIETKAV